MRRLSALLSCRAAFFSRRAARKAQEKEIEVSRA
jgi:hypothetical protein